MNTRMKARARRGFTLIEVALATVVLTVGILFASTFFTNVYEQLSPKGEYGGLRRYILAEQMLMAQAEAMRATKHINPGTAKLVTEPAGSGYDLRVRMTQNGSNARQDYYFYDLEMRHGNQVIGTLSLSTLRRKDGKDAKVGL